jgi:hypothetical protein
MLWILDSPRYPVDVDDNLLAEWLLSMCTVLDQKERQRMRQRRRFKLALGLAPATAPAAARPAHRPGQGREAPLRQAHLDEAPHAQLARCEEVEGWSIQEIWAGKRAVQAVPLTSTGEPSAPLETLQK